MRTVLRSQRVLELTVNVEPFGKQRPFPEVLRLPTGPIAVLKTPPETRRAEARIRRFITAYLPHDWVPIDDTLRVSGTAFVRVPESLPRREWGLALPGSRPDIDNAAKLILDALTSNQRTGYVGVWTDDCRITDAPMRKRYAWDGRPRWEIVVERVWLERHPDDGQQALPLAVAAEDRQH